MIPAPTALSPLFLFAHHAREHTLLLCDRVILPFIHSLYRKHKHTQYNNSDCLQVSSAENEKGELPAANENLKSHTFYSEYFLFILE